MRFPPFELERWQSLWEHRVEINLAESGVRPLDLRELAPEQRERETLLRLPLGYAPTNGSATLRTRIAELYPGADERNVLVTCGCSEANLLVTLGALEAGDDLVFMQPNYWQIAGVARAMGARVRPWLLRREAAWIGDADELERIVTPRTRLIAVCNPNNPTGAVLDESTIRRIVDVAARIGATVLSDEVYRGSERIGGLTPSFWRPDRPVVCTGGLSKAYGLPGLRIGWIVASEERIEALWAAHDYTSIAPTTLGDHLATLALEPRRRARILARTRPILRNNFALVEGWLNQRPEWFDHVPPTAGAISWSRYLGPQTTVELAETLRLEKSVLVVAGEQLGASGYLRIGFGGPEDELRCGLERLEQCLPGGSRHDRRTAT